MIDQETFATIQANFRASLPRIISGEETDWNRPPITGPAITTRAKVFNAVVKETGVCKSDILGPRKDTRRVEARQMAYFLMAELCPQSSLPQIGRIMNRDHTTIILGIRSYALKRTADPDLLAVEMRVREAVLGET